MFVKTEGMNQWEKKWVVFEDNEVRYGDQASASERDYERVSMDRVVNLTADVSLSFDERYIWERLLIFCVEIAIS